jgi:hypothetical protein
MAVGQLGLVQNQDDGLAVGGSPLQSLTRKRFHDRVADHQRIAEQARNPLIAHVGTVGLKRQSSRKLHQIRAAHIEHRRDQKRQLLALGLSLLRQASPKFRTDTVCDLLNTVHEARSDSTKGGTLESHTVSRRQQPSTQLIDGKVLEHVHTALENLEYDTFRSTVRGRWHAGLLQCAACRQRSCRPSLRSSSGGSAFP